MEKNRPVRVVVAEDDYFVALTVRRLLEGIGCQVVGEAADGLEAVELTRELQPDVVIMDVGMDRMDGIAATRAIQVACPTPVVILSAYETDDLVAAAQEAGAGAYLVKMPDAARLEQTISGAIATFAW